MNFFAKQKDFKVYISGSNSKLLSSELGTLLTGRHRDITLYPLSFREISKQDRIETKRVTQESRIQAVKLTKRYLAVGGFPRAWITQDSSILGEYYTNVLSRDIVKRKRVKNTVALERLGLMLMSKIGRKLNKSKLAESIGLQNGDTVERYISYFEECYLGFQIKRYDPSVKKQLRSQSKFYAIDAELANRVGIPNDSKLAFYLENLVLIELLRRGAKVYYWNSQGSEVDFFVETAERTRELIQVCWSLENEETLAREVKGFSDFAVNHKKLKVSRKLIITLEGQRRQINDDIEVLPFYQWALE
jgi:predicted AAA+ superfamily ATPase